MSVLVSVPTKIRIDREALLDHPDWVEEALLAAVGRALANSRRSVVDLRGDYLDVRLHDPVFAWTGLPLDGDLRADLEGRVAGWLRQAALDAGVGVRAPDSDVPGVLPPDPSEPFDALRDEPLGGMYAIDSYGGGDEVVPLGGGRVLIHPKFQYVKIVSSLYDEEVESLMATLDPPPTREQPRGVIYRITWDPGMTWRIVVSNGFDDDSIISSASFGNFLKPVFRGIDANPQIEEIPFEPPADVAEAEVVDLPSDEEGRKKFWMERIGAAYSSELRRHWTQPIKLTYDAYEKQIRDHTEEHIALRLQTLPANATKVIRISMSGSNFWLLVESENADKIGWSGTALLEPVVDPKRGGGGNAETAEESPGAKAKKGEGASDKKGGGGSPDGDKNGSPNGQVRGKGSSGGGGKCPPDDAPEGDQDSDVSMECVGLRGEPGTDEIGDAGVRLDKQIAAIAQKLDISPCKFAGQFCYQAAVKIGQRAEETQSMDETAKGSNQATVAGKGNMGPGDFKPGGSPIIAVLRDLAEAVSMVTNLVHDLVNLFESPTYECTIHGWRRGNGVGWALDLLEAVAPPLREAVGSMFVGACRSMLIQMLVTSYDEIDKRLKAMDRYGPLFEQWILPQIIDDSEYELLRRSLRNYGYAKAIDNASGGMAKSAVSSGNWASATGALVQAIGSAGLVHSLGKAYDVVQDGGIDKVRDSRGVLWSMDDLEQGLKLKRGTLEGIDPLVKQMTDTPEAVARFKAAGSVRAELERLLKEMATNNGEMAGKANVDAAFAFKASGIREDIPQATIPYSKYNLQGIHRIAHEAIGDAFKGSGYYAMGIDYLFDSELGKEALKGLGIMVGIVLLCVFVPGGGFIAFVGGVALADHELDAAKEKERLYKSLINPDLVLSHAEVEVGLFVAYFGLVVSFIPEAGTATKALFSGGKAILKGEGRAVVGMAGKAIASRVAKEFVEYAAKDLLVAFIHELTTNVVMDQIIQKAMAPLIEEVEHNASVGQNEPGSTVPELDEEAEMQREFIAMILEETLTIDGVDGEDEE